MSAHQAFQLFLLCLMGVWEEEDVHYKGDDLWRFLSPLCLLMPASGLSLIHVWYGFLN